MIIFLIGLATSCATLAGGFFALRFKDHLHLVLGFSAGAVIGVAFFDLLPEAIGLGSPVYTLGTMTSVVALGFTVYLILDRFAVLHSHDEDHSHGSHRRGKLGAASLSIHSFLDGLAIGLAFKVSSSVGVIVAIAVLVHDFSDGINTVNVILKNKGSIREAYRWLFVDALTPLAGVLATTFFSLSESSLGLVLALFCGFFLYIGASDLLPESHHGHPKMLTTIMTLLGIGVLYIAIEFAGV
ncbi:MAG: ZIP family metal transporter [Patescibacteria group bacterium]